MWGLLSEEKSHCKSRAFSLRRKMRRLKTRNTTTDFYEIQLFKYEKFQRKKSKKPLAFKKWGSFEIEELVVAASVLNQWQGI